MELSQYLGKVAGSYLVIMAAVLLVRKDFFKSVLEDFYRHPGLIALGAVLNLIIGLLLVFGHNLWGWNWFTVITVLGYLSLIKGVMNLLIPYWGQGVGEKMLSGQASLFLAAIYLIAGGGLLYASF